MMVARFNVQPDDYDVFVRPVKDGKYVLYEEHEKLRLLIAEVIIRFSAFDGDFMTRLLDSLEEG